MITNTYNGGTGLLFKPLDGEDMRTKSSSLVLATWDPVSQKKKVDEWWKLKTINKTTK